MSLRNQAARRVRGARTRDGVAAALRRLAAAMAVALAVVAGAPVAHADIFSITGVEIEATASTAAEAKQIAIASGQAKALAQLFRKLTRPEDASRLPPVDAETLQQVVIGFSLGNERTGPTQYLADLTVRFHPDAVELLLAQHDIEIAVTQSPPTLLVPAYRSPDGVALFDTPNPLAQTLRGMGLDGRLVPALLPIGDATDAALDRNAVLAADAEALASLMARYGVEFAVVAIASYEPDRAVLTGRLTGLAPSGPLDFSRRVDVVPGEEGEALRKLTGDLLDGLDEAWRVASSTGELGPSSEEFAFVVPFRDLQEWVAVRGRLETMPGVERLEIETLAAGSASVVVRYDGDLSGFLNGLDGLGFAMYDTGQRWELGLR